MPICCARPSPSLTRRGILPRIIGEIPSAAAPPPDCTFHPRCGAGLVEYARAMPPLVPLSGGRAVACHLYSPISGGASRKCMDA